MSYKAALAGSFAIKMDADDTSKACPRCGHTADEKRPRKGLLFVCQNPKCRYTLHADLVGARNLVMRTLVLRQDWSTTGHLSIAPDTSDNEAKAARLTRYAELRRSPDASLRSQRRRSLTTNSDNGWSLQTEVLYTIAQVYAWPELPSREDHERLDAVSDTYVGECELRSGLSLNISNVGNHLFFQMPGQPPLKLLRRSDTAYLLANMDDEIIFVRDGQRNVQELILQQGEIQTIALSSTLYISNSLTNGER
jgi:ssDNA-binding Zn-finger/Zn-ribbon topoisomerase 1